MRRNLTKKHSTKAERVVYEVLKELHLPFKHRWIIGGREIDFLIGNYILEIDGHDQDPIKNKMLAEAGYIPIHLHNRVADDKQSLKLTLKQLLWQQTQEQISSHDQTMSPMNE